MKHFVVRLILFLTGVVVAVTLSTAVAYECASEKVSPSAGWDNMSRRLAEVDTTGDIDVLFIGSSHCYRTFNPEHYASAGLRTFNLGSSAQTPSLSLLLIESYVSTLRPRSVVFEVHPDVLKSVGSESLQYLIAAACPVNLSSDLRSRLMKMALERSDVPALRAAMAHLLHSSAHDALPPMAVPTGNNIFAYKSGGFVECTAINGDSVFSTYDCTPSELQLQALKQLVTFLCDRKIIPIVVVTPDESSRYDSYSNYQSFMSSVKEATAGAIVIDYNDSLAVTSRLDDKLSFADSWHLNAQGAAVVDSHLAACLSVMLNR